MLKEAEELSILKCYERTFNLQEDNSLFLKRQLNHSARKTKIYFTFL